MGLIPKKGDIVFLDTSPFIYFFEEHPDYHKLLADFFDKIYQTDAQIVTSIITYIEVTTHPARLGNTRLVRKYREYLTHSDNLTLFPLDPTIADYAVDFRAKYALKTTDAIQLGTAVATGADYVITNDQA